MALLKLEGILRRAFRRASTGDIRCVLLSLAFIVVPIVAVAQSQIPAQSVAWQSGTITAIYETTIQIDGRTFSLAPDAVILDDTGNQMDASELVVTVEVKYHVKQASRQASKQDSKQDNKIEQQDKIDRMIVVLPR